MQTKGGTEDILVYGNLFVNAGSRAIKMGGSTGADYFRPIDAPFEGKNIQAIANVIIGSEASIAFASAVDCLAANNTIYTPTTWIMRILNENTSKLPPQNGRFLTTSWSSTIRRSPPSSTSAATPCPRPSAFRTIYGMRWTIRDSAVRRCPRRRPTRSSSKIRNLWMRPVGIFISCRPVRLGERAWT